MRYLHEGGPTKLTMGSALRRICLVCLTLPLLHSAAVAQEQVYEDSSAPAPTAPEADSHRERSVSSLSALQRSREAKATAISSLREQIAKSEIESERTELQAQLRTLQNELAQINADFESIATGIDLETFDLAPPESFNLQAEVQKLVQPLIEELKDATESPRQIERLRSEIDYLAGREELAQDALNSVETLLESLTASDPENLRPALEESREAWKARIQEVQGQSTVTKFQLEKRLSQRKSILESTQSALGDFFRTRGLNLALAIATFFAVLIFLRTLYRYISRALPQRKSEERQFYARLIDVLYFLFVTAFALTAALLVLYATGDWVLLGVTLLFLVGVAWAFKTGIPMFLEQIRLLLNFGTVRERERLVLDGIPYRVSKLSFYTLLSNPNLAGGVRRLPIKDLGDLRSRTCSKDEIWFPTKRGDWVLLSDGKRGEIKHQSPDMVQIELLGGSRVTYQSSDFLAMAPQNLSEGFRCPVKFGIDYAHQAISTTTVPQIFATDVRAAVEAKFGPDSLTNLKVEFCEAGASSLDYLVIADFAGSAAPHFDAIARAIQKACVETCNQQGWGIPFTQITLHQAGA